MGEMHEKSDAQLLRDYAQQGDEAAFAELVNRHTNLVYSAAARQVDSPDLAAEVAQSAFIGLAHGARSLLPRLTEGASLAGWLCRSARNISLNLRRDEFRRHSRERQAMEQFNPTSETATDWERLRPLLDDAMSELDETDYDALVMRFFKNQHLRSVGLALGVSDDTAQKRVARALDKLREHLSRRGINTTAAALSVVLTANAVQAAPVGLAVTISTAAALAGTSIANSTATVTALKLMSPVVLKSIIAASTAIAASILIVMQHKRVDQLREQNESLKAQAQKTETASAELSEQLQTLTRERENNPRQAELFRLRGEATRLHGLEAEFAKLREELLRQQEQSRATSAAQAATEEAIQKFDAQRAMTINTMKQVGLQLRGLAVQNNLNAAFTADGNLNPTLVSGLDLRNVELLVNDSSQLEKLLGGAPDTILARTAEPVPTPDGRWLRAYILADGSVQCFSTLDSNQAFTGTLNLKSVRP